MTSHVAMRVPSSSRAGSRLRGRAHRLTVARAHEDSSQRRGTAIARWHRMTCTTLRTTLVCVALSSLGACSRPASQPRTLGPVIGESTAPGPVDPTRRAPDPGSTVTTVHLQGAPRPVANPAPAGDTLPSRPAPANPVVVTPGVVTGPAPVGVGSSGVNPNGPGAGAAGPNGPGTGNGPPAPTGPATAPRAPATPPANNGPGTGNLPINPQPPVPAPSVPPVTPPTTSPTPQPSAPPAPSAPAPAPIPTPQSMSTNSAAASTSGGVQR